MSRCGGVLHFENKCGILIVRDGGYHSRCPECQASGKHAKRPSPGQRCNRRLPDIKDRDNPIREALRTLCWAEPPRFVRGYDLDNLSDREKTLLQNWAGEHARPEWATSLGMLDAAELIVRQALENGNITKA